MFYNVTCRQVGDVHDGGGQSSRIISLVKRFTVNHSDINLTTTYDVIPHLGTRRDFDFAVANRSAVLIFSSFSGYTSVPL